MTLAPGQLEQIARALADPQRLRILERTAAAGELCASDLPRFLPLSQALPAISQNGCANRQVRG